MDIGITIRSLREDWEWKQGEFAKKVGLTQASLSHIENGTTKCPSYESLEKICKGLNISVGELYIQSLSMKDFPNAEEKAEIILPIIKNLINQIK